VKKWALFMVVYMNMLDVYTTMLPGGEEANHWVRGIDHQPILSYVIWVKVMFYFFMGIMLLVAYLQTKKLSQMLADFLVVVACLYDAFQFIETVVGNVVVHKGWVN